MAALTLIVTTAGLDALVDAQNGDTDAIVIAELGIASAPFAASPALTALPNEIKRVGAVAGQSVAPNIIHMVAQDSSDAVYTAYGIGLYLSDGTLFAVYAQAQPIVTKVSIAAFLIALDVAFLQAVEGAINFGNAAFLNPPATESVRGVAKIATDALADAGTDDSAFMTAKKVRRVLSAFASALTATVTAALDAFAARRITVLGVATGGGDLGSDRTITVPRQTIAEILAGLSDDGVITAAGLWSFPGARGGDVLQIPGTSWMVMFASGVAQANSTTTILLPMQFPNGCRWAGITGGRIDGNAQDNNPFVSSFGADRVSIFSALGNGVATTVFAIGY